MTEVSQMNRREVEAAFVEAANSGDYKLKKALWARVWELTELRMWDGDPSYSPALKD